jgi:maltose alpha-D-glucosyltransferase/alpha-amylase
MFRINIKEAVFMVQWLNDAVFYEIYPQSFCDSNGDGIGDIQGMISKLDYIKDLGCNALWINPVYDSPFMDAGYDVRDYYKIAERYGTNEDMYRFFNEAHKRNIKVLMDLVPGHTSDQHQWFRESQKNEVNQYSGRYVWTSNAFEGIDGHPYISGMTERPGAYMLNFFASQPALNYGWGVRTEKWQSAVDSPEALATAEDLKNIMRFWMNHGCDGFRVDMADSLVKNDDDKKHATAAIWHGIRKMMDQDYPEAALVSEWSNPQSSINLAGFHMDFYLDHFGNGYNTLLRDYEGNFNGDRSYFKKDGNGDIQRFLSDYLPKYGATFQNGFISMLTCNHDTPRASLTLSQEEMKIAWAFIFTMPGVPFLYYGDEIGMKFVNVPSKEGGYHRTGSRSPMQWNSSRNYGFSTAEEDRLYIAQDSDKNAPTVEKQMGDSNSLYNVTKQLIALRHAYTDLHAGSSFKVLEADKSLFVYQRGDLICAVNPSDESCHTVNDMLAGKKEIFSINSVTAEGNKLDLGPGSFAVLQ